MGRGDVYPSSSQSRWEQVGFRGGGRGAKRTKHPSPRRRAGISPHSENSGLWVLETSSSSGQTQQAGLFKDPGLFSAVVTCRRRLPRGGSRDSRWRSRGPAGCWDSPRARGARSRPWSGCRWIREELASARSWDFFSVGAGALGSPRAAGGARLVRARGPGRAPGGGRSEPDPEIGDPLRACAGAARAERGPRGDGAGARKARDGGSCRELRGPPGGCGPPAARVPGSRGAGGLQGPGPRSVRREALRRGPWERRKTHGEVPTTGHRSPVTAPPRGGERRDAMPPALRSRAKELRRNEMTEKCSENI